MDKSAVLLIGVGIGLLIAILFLKQKTSHFNLVIIFPEGNITNEKKIVRRGLDKGKPTWLIDTITYKH